jgi:hypothetical protein
VEVSCENSDDDSAERRSSGNVWSRHMHSRQLSSPLSSPQAAGGNRRKGSVNSAGSSFSNSGFTKNSGGSSRNNRGTRLNLSSEEWFTVATLMPDQVFGESSILHQMDKFTPAIGAILIKLIHSTFKWCNNNIRRWLEYEHNKWYTAAWSSRFYLFSDSMHSSRGLLVTSKEYHN